MAALERYTADPRYCVRFEDYMGSMSIGNDAFSDNCFPERDKIALQTFGLGFTKQRIPYVVVYLRYLANLSPEHQQHWNSYLTANNVSMCKQYFESSILGEFWENRSVRYAIIKEIGLINGMSETIWGNSLFRELPEKEVPIGLTSFLRPTANNFNRFVMALDKVLSESISIKFFDGLIPREREIERKDGKVEVQQKGSLALLEDFLVAEIAIGSTKIKSDLILHESHPATMTR